MPALSDILSFAHGQLLQTPSLPSTSLAGKTIVITGANTGLGFECAKQVAALDASIIILACRNLTKGEAAKNNIPHDEKTKIHVWQLDMASFSSVKAFADRLKTLPRLDALVANAGISTNDYSVADGFESTLTVNVISTFLLAILVLPQLSSQAQQTHLTIVGSNVHCFADHTQLQKPSHGQVFEDLSDKRQADMAARYFLSKLIVMLCVQELASRTDSSKTVVNCPSPGWCKTELFRQDDGGFWGRNMLKLIGRTPEEGARCLTSALTAGEDSHGHYLSECRVKPTSVFVRSTEGQHLQGFLFEELLAIIKTIDPDALQGLER